MNEVSPLIRAAIFVSSLDESTSFYRDLLNLEDVFFEGELDGPVVNDLLGMPGTSTTRAIILKQPGPNFGMIGLFEVSNPHPPDLSRPSRGCHTGEICMVFYCRDLDEVCAKLARWGTEVICPPKYLELESRPGVRHREMIFRGPDGEMINLIERSPSEAFQQLD